MSWGGDAGMDDEREVEFGRKIEKSAADVQQRGDVGLDDGGLDFQNIERVAGVQFAEFGQLGLGFAQWVHDRKRNGGFTDVRIQIVDLLQHTLVFEGVGHRFQSTVDQLLTAHGGDVEDRFEIMERRPNDPHRSGALQSPTLEDPARRDGNR